MVQKSRRKLKGVTERDLKALWNLAIFSIFLIFFLIFDIFNNKQWFISNKLSLNIKKTKYWFFQKPSQKEDIPLLLPKLITNNYEIQPIEVFGGFSGWKLKLEEHIKCNENKIATILGLLCKAKHYLNNIPTSVILFLYITWGSNNRTNLKKIKSTKTCHSHNTL